MTMVADPECEYCLGHGERYWHSEDCQDGLCALNGDYHSCLGQMQDCPCLRPSPPNHRRALRKEYPMRRLVIELTNECLERLAAAADEERRDPRNQAAILLEAALGLRKAVSSRLPAAEPEESFQDRRDAEE